MRIQMEGGEATRSSARVYSFDTVYPRYYFLSLERASAVTG